MRFCSILLLVFPALAADITRVVPNVVVATSVVRADARSGRLIRTAPVTARPDLSKSDASSMIAMIDRKAEAEGVESALVHSVIRAESNYNPHAISPKGALGIMQLIPSTAKRFGVTNVFDPEDNVGGGVRYLKFLLDYFQGDYPRAIAAYNAGEGAVEKFKGIPPYPETRNYVWQVAQNLKEVRKTRPSQAAAPLASTQTTETVHPIQVTTDADGRTYFKTP